MTFNRNDSYGTGAGQVFIGAGTITKEGAGDLVFNGSVDHTNVQGISNIVVNNGMIRTDNWGQWNSNLNLTVNGSGKFEMWNGSVSLASLSGNGTVQNTKYWGRSQTLTVAAGSFSGSITDLGITSGGSGTGDTRINLIKSSPGTLLFAGSNTYSGATTVNAGTLEVNGSLASGSAVSIGGAAATGTPTLTGTGTVAGPVTINADSGGAAGTLNPGAVGATGQISTGPATINGILAIDLDAGSADKLVVTGNLGIAAATLAFNTISAPTALSYDLASYTGSLDATAFAAVNNLPSGYQLQFDATNKLIKLVRTSPPTTPGPPSPRASAARPPPSMPIPMATGSPTASNGSSAATRA